MLKSALVNGAGKRNTRVEVQRATSGEANTAGEVLPEFNTFCARFAEVAASGGREFQAALQTVPMLQEIVKLHYDGKTSTITARDRIVIGSRTLNIAAVFNEAEANEKIVIWCVEVP